MLQSRNQLPGPADPSLQSVRTDRANLDRMLVDLKESRASLAEQLHDLECVIEQTGNDVLQHRCRITVPYVQTLDSRLDSINRAVSSTCGKYVKVCVCVCVRSKIGEGHHLSVHSFLEINSVGNVRLIWGGCAIRSSFEDNCSNKYEICI